MKNIIFLLLISFGCSQKPETNISEIISSNLDSLALVHKEQINILQINHQSSIDSLTTILSNEKMRSAADLNLYDFENYIRHHCDVLDDSIRILGANRYATDAGRHVISFIDYNLTSRFHDILKKGYRFNYNKADSLSKLNKDLKNGHWLKIEKYNKYNYAFFYEMCEFASRGFTISDSLFVTYQNMEEVDGSVMKINSISSYDKQVNINDARILLTPTEDNPDIYVWDDQGKKCFVTHQSSLNKYPIIVQDCHDMGTQPQVKFLEPK